MGARTFRRVSTPLQQRINLIIQAMLLVAILFEILLLLACAVSLAQICSRCAHYAPTLLSDQHPHPQDSLVMGLLFGINYHAIRPVDVVAVIAPCPLFFIHGGADTIVPPEHFKLLAAATSAGADAHVQTWLIAGAQHIQSYITGAEYTSRVVTFFIAALGPAARTVEAAEG